MNSKTKWAVVPTHCCNGLSNTNSSNRKLTLKYIRKFRIARVMYTCMFAFERDGLNRIMVAYICKPNQIMSTLWWLPSLQTIFVAVHYQATWKTIKGRVAVSQSKLIGLKKDKCLWGQAERDIGLTTIHKNARPWLSNVDNWTYCEIPLVQTDYS